jgi:hypothetical protein
VQVTARRVRPASNHPTANTSTTCITDTTMSCGGSRLWAEEMAFEGAAIWKGAAWTRYGVGRRSQLGNIVYVD